ncbi:ABC transporter permease [Paenibacillus rigui]|uniref:Sugar ABC transporter permease n=1 Tax=Paenibacillus rigui TaxID=554312 RepID=A0A229UQ94_9BACL|nr:ABC transporter permease subunit [Paenibacillus rigui]OXM85395.1 sugar ABC transporter permease [Paenibacillus rigui]
MERSISVNESQALLPRKKRTGLAAFIYEIARNKLMYAMALPGLLFFFVFSYLPMGGMIIAFQDFKAARGITGSKFVGFKNFAYFFQTDEWILIVWNTLYLNFLFILSGTVISIAIAVMLTEIGSRWFKKGAQSFVILPHFISWTVVAMLITMLLSTDTGMVNKLIVSWGGEPIAFFQSPEHWPWLLMLMKVWHSAGFGSIVYLASIAGINPDIYEAASIDGASRWQKITFITLPLLKTTVILLLLLSIGKIFYGDFGMIYAIIGRNPLLYPTTDVIDTYVYRALTDLGDMSMAAAVGFFQSVVGFILVVTVNQIAKKFNSESAIF